MMAATNVRTALKLLDDAVKEIPSEVYPMVCGLIKGAIVATYSADKELSKSVHDATERITG